MDRRRRVLPAALLALSLAVLVVGALLPWVRTGGATRNSFSTVRTARTLELLGGSFGATALGLWYFVPALASVAVLLVVLRRDRAAVAVAGVVAALTVGFAAIVVLAPVDAGVGVPVALVAAIAAAASAAWLWRARTR